MFFTAIAHALSRVSPKPPLLSPKGLRTERAADSAARSEGGSNLGLVLLQYQGEHERTEDN